MEDSKKRNITIEAMEDDDNKTEKAVVKSGNFDEKNYLNVNLDYENGELTKEIKIRLLPIDGKSDTPFKRIRMHNLKVPKTISRSGFKSYVCLEKTEDIDHEKYGRKCPFCEMNREAYKKSTEADNDVDKKRYQDISLANLSNEVGIIRCIERGHEEDGPKFWKFNIRQDKKDPLNVIKKLFATRLQESRDEGDGDLNILDLYEGKDLKLTITCVMDKNTGKPTNKKTIDIVDYGKIKPISDDEEKIDKWVNDEKVWSDVFVPKTYEYLSVLLDGEEPWFDRDEGKWIAKSAYEAKRNGSNEKKCEDIKKSDEKINEAVKIVTVESTQNNDNDDLPF